MKVEGTRSARGGRRAVVAALASILLASCATSGGEETFFGFNPSDQSALTTQAAGDFAGTAVSGEQTAGAVGEFVMDDDDPSLPDAIAAAPSIRPGSETELASAAGEQPAPGTVAEAAQPAAGEAQPAATETAVAAAAPAAPADQQAAEEPPEQQATQFLENAPSAQAATVAAAEPKKRGFLAAFFGTQSARAAPAPKAPAPLIATASPKAEAQEAEKPEAKPIVQLASTNPSAATPIIPQNGEALPGVRPDSLFEISRRSGIDDDSDIDLHEGDDSYQVASAAGLARLAPNGLTKQTEHVDVACLKPSLVRVLKTVERHYGRNVVVTSGYRNPERNRRARGARNSLHMYCAAADVQVAGVGKWELAEFLRSMPGRGGVGTYCHTNSVHIDVGPERDWNWRCRRRK